MGNINLQRYHDSIGHSGKSFFNKWYRKKFEKFYRKHESEYIAKNEIVSDAYRLYMDGGMSKEDYTKVRKITIHYYLILYQDFLSCYQKKYTHGYVADGKSMIKNQNHGK